MKVTIVGVERAEGVSMKTGKAKPYAMANIHAILRLDSRPRDGAMSKGSMGASYRVDPELVKRIEHNPFPMEAELVIEDVISMGKKESNVTDVIPIGVKPVQQLQKAA